MRLADFIDGSFRPPVSEKYFKDLSPATAEVIAEVPDSDQRDVALAVDAATKAFDTWRRTSAEQRSTILLRMADVIERNAEELAQLESLDCGKPIALARRMDIARAIANFRFFATAILHERSEMHATDDRALNYTLSQPVGVAGLISPWNLPLYLLTWKIAPALAAGNCVVAKPSELAPLTANRLAELSLEAGIPAGVLNIVHGYGGKAGAAIVAHPGVRAISFTGGTVTGREVMKSAGPLFKKISLELGGKNPNIIFADADLDEAVSTTVQSSFANQGEICLCGSRILVEQSVYEQFLERFVEATSKLRIGDPSEDATEVGALISAAHLSKVSGFIDLARREGRIVYGGNRPELPEHLRNGYFLEPTIVTEIAEDCSVFQDEVFGPFVTVTPFRDADEAIRLANSTRYGLSASVWTRDLSRAHLVAAALDSGTVWINTWLLRDLRVPFGGMKESGLGREGGFESLAFFSETKNVCVKL